MVALLGRRDEPTDALRDYCFLLSEAIHRHGAALELAEVNWAVEGWRRALRKLWRQSRAWRSRWVLLQYTALMWSRRGFPFPVLAVLCVLRLRRSRIAAVLHDARAYEGNRMIDRLRRACQNWVMRRIYAWTERCFPTVPPHRLPWLPRNSAKAVFIPAGANLPVPAESQAENGRCQRGATVAVFGVTSGTHTEQEVADIAYALERAKDSIAPLRLVVLGRGSSEAESHLRHALQGSGVEVSVLGLLPSEKLAGVLSAADVLLFVRGHVSSRRSSAIAGIACGLPVVGYSGLETDYPITAAGVLLVPQRDREALARALHRVLTEPALRRELRERSRAAQREHFSWDAITGRYLAALADYELALTSASPSCERKV